ncbi:MAG: hypothetical protein Q9186_000926 [Xanthomendoza sp. 1 TL-2023]
MSGLRPVAQEAYVCLRCQVRIVTLSAKPPHSLQELPQKSQRRTLSTRPRRLQQLANYDNDNPNDPTLFEDDVIAAGKLDQRGHDIKLPDDDDDTRHKSPYRFRRPNLYSKDALGLTTLGKPAEVLRVHERPKTKFIHWWHLDTPSHERPSLTEPLTSSEIIERVNAERGLVSTLRASQNIEQLRQDWLSNLKQQDVAPTKSEYDALGRQLYDGFITKQLTAYLKDFRVPIFTSILDLSGSFRSASVTRTEWRIGTTPFPGDAWNRLQDLIEEQKSQDAVPVFGEYALFAESKRSGDPVKQLLVDKILRLCWKIKPREELDSIGEVDIMIPETHLELLASHRRNILQQLAVEYDAKVDFSKAENTARLTANQATCTSSLKLLLMVLEEVTCHEVILNEVGGTRSKVADHQALFNGPLLREIERLSSTVIRWSKGGNATSPNPKKVKVYLTFGPSLGRATAAFYGGMSNASAKLSPIPVAGTNSIPLTDRGTEWARMSLVNHKQRTRKSAKFSPSKALKAVEGHTQAPRTLMKIDNRISTHPHWGTTLFQKSSVVLGQVLYPTQIFNSIDPSDSLLDALNSRRVFDTNVPGVTKTLELQSFKTHVMEELRVHLKATTISKTEGNHNVEPPDLELCFAIHPFNVKPEKREVVSQSIHLILKNKQADLLLPHEPLDLRLATKVYVKATSDLDPRIADFINQSTFDIWGEGGTDRKFETPKRLTIGIPQPLLSRGNKVSKKEMHDGEVPVEYSFAGIEHHHIVRGRPAQSPHQRMFDLSFSIIDAGPIGGRRQEVRFFDDRALEFVAGNGKTAEEGEVSQQSKTKSSTVQGLYDCAHDLIRKLEARNSEIAHGVGPRHSGSRMSNDVDEVGRATGRHLVRTLMSDVPMGSVEAERLMEGPSRARVRRVAADDDDRLAAV